MLREVSKEVLEINAFIDRCNDMLSVVNDMEKSDTLNFDVVREDINNKAYRCWYGMYSDKFDCPSFNYHEIAQFIGANSEDAIFMFGPGSSATLHQRVRHMQCHVFQLERKRGELL